MSSSPTITPKRTLEDLLIVFTDVTSFTRVTRNPPAAEAAEAIDEPYILMSDKAAAANGRVVKYLGDGALLVWDADHTDEAVAALVELRTEARELFQRHGWDCTLKVTVHFGPVISGEFGAERFRQYDVIGSAVMTAARLEGRTLSLSQAAFRTLSPETRQLLKKHTPPVVYIPTDDPRP